jgi:hypothetical protein
VWGGGIQLFEVTNSAWRTSIIEYPVALGSRCTMNSHTTTNKKQEPIIEESRERRQDYQGAWWGGGVNPSFWQG